MRFLDQTILHRFQENPASHAIQVTTLPEEVLHSPQQHFTFTCPVDNSNGEEKRWHYMKVYPTTLTSESEDIVPLQVLSMLLFRGQASPFYKSLIESNVAQLMSPLQGYVNVNVNVVVVDDDDDDDDLIFLFVHL